MDRLNHGDADAVMIGRGAMGNPWVFRDFCRLATGEEPIPVTNGERRRVILLHYRRMLETRPEHVAVREMRKFIAWYLRGLRGASRMRAEINRANDPQEAFRLLDQFFRETDEGKT